MRRDGQGADVPFKRWVEVATMIAGEEPIPDHRPARLRRRLSWVEEGLS
jgi:hypothetical protein